MEKPFLDVVKNKSVRDKPVWWMMRQAGRYLPEYLEVRGKAGSFLKLAYTPEYAAEVTLQPIRRYDMDAAILFSDILVIPHALGQDLKFVQGEGPKLTPIDSVSELNYNNFDQVLSPVYQAVGKIKSQLHDEGFTEKTLIGFAGAPWTVACYMIEGGGSKDFANVKRFAYGNSVEFQKIIDLLCEATARYLCAQIQAGAEVIQIFDTWAGLLDEKGFRDFCIAPIKKIIETVRSEYPDIPVIGFPRGAGALYEDFVKETGVNVVGIDPSISPKWAAKVLQPHCVVQGNLDPIRLLAGGAYLEDAIDDVLSHLSQGPHIFNLGHGIHKDTPLEHVERLRNQIATYRI